MEIILAKSAGFCTGVSNAYDTAKENAKEGVYTYGPIAHNDILLKELEDDGIKIIDELEEIDKFKIDKILLRSHGVKPEVYEILDNKNIPYIDMTCPWVKKIHKKVKEKYTEGYKIIIIGDREHKEIIAINGYIENTGIIIGSPDEISGDTVKKDEKYSIVSQTTFRKEVFDEIIDKIIEINPNVEINNTICYATKVRQDEAKDIASKVDCMIVLGDKKSSNTTKLYEICKEYCTNTLFIESINELELNILSTFDRIGITAGASTPPAIIKEAVNSMSELDKNSTNAQTFEEMLDENMVTLRSGEIVKGEVIQIANGEVSVNLGYKSDGLITRDEFSDNPDINPEDEVEIGDEIEVYIIRVNDGEGNVLLSKKRLEMQKGYTDLEEAFNNETTVKAKIMEVVKGGLISSVKGVRAFIPASQISSRYVDNLEEFVGQELEFNVLEYDRQRRRIVIGRRDILRKEEEEKRKEIFATIEPGKTIKGTVSRIVDFGAFVDLGGADGLIHISELSWGRVKKTSDVLKEGQEIEVAVLSVDEDQGRISLSLKDTLENPWDRVNDKYPVGEVVKGIVVRLVPFGAFIELEPGVDGLVHISQIAHKHVVKPEDELTIGEEIDVKVVDINVDEQKISLSKKDADDIMGIDESEEAVEEETVEEIDTVDEEVEEAVLDDEEIVEESEIEETEETETEEVEEETVLEEETIEETEEVNE